MLGVPIGLALTIITLPGTWAMLLVAAGAKLWQPELMSWWTLGVCAGLALLGEAIELVASGVGAKAAGGSRAGSMGALIGSIAGAIIGIPFIPPAGPIVGAVLGAALGALIGERGYSKRTWGRSSGVAAGAAAGRAVSIMVKLLLSGLVGLILFVACLW